MQGLLSSLVPTSLFWNSLSLSKLALLLAAKPQTGSGLLYRLYSDSIPLPLQQNVVEALRQRRLFVSS